MKKSEVLENILVENFAAEGKSIARIEGKILFIENAVPGDVVDVRIYKSKKSFMEGVSVKFHELSPLRLDPFCPHFGVCGGCKWQNVNYQTQIEYKHQQVIDQLTKIGKVSIPEIMPILPSKETIFYRNKLEYTFSNNRWLTKEEIDTQEDIERNALGFHIPGKYDKIVDVETCFLQPEPSNTIRNIIKEYAKQKGLSFFDIKKQEGFLRNLIIRTANSTGEVMVLLQVFHESEDVFDLLDHLYSTIPGITSLNYVINPKKNETFNDLEVVCHKGLPYIVEEIEGLKFRIGPKSFFQTNSVQAYELYKITRAFAGLTGSEIVYDLYTGTGTIANFVASKAKKVVGLEYVEMAIEDAKINSSINGIKNTVFYSGDIKDLLNNDFFEKEGRPEVIITDPPRAGMHADVVEMINISGAKRIVYVSCNPATQARDLSLLDSNYEIVKVQPVDMFPHTYHVENVVLLERRDAGK
ncbi:MAG TPA: 23S rRNA (uracil(1939)-C(5))-methyltransferase RlmD [Cytophagales bacterium]|nr:23S rRNA (uracil(1939)-C(5))-methyltransferase RlmD [Cytophagales bacterium]